MTRHASYDKYAYAAGRLSMAMRLAAVDLERNVAPITVANTLRQVLDQVDRELAHGTDNPFSSDNT